MQWLVTIILRGQGVNDVRMVGLLKRLFEWPVNSDVQWLGDAGAATRNEVEDDIGVVGAHPIAEWPRSLD
jgi:hypothetical protein